MFVVEGNVHSGIVSTGDVDAQEESFSKRGSSRGSGVDASGPGVDDVSVDVSDKSLDRVGSVRLEERTVQYDTAHECATDIGIAHVDEEEEEEEEEEEVEEDRNDLERCSEVAVRFSIPPVSAQAEKKGEEDEKKGVSTGVEKERGDMIKSVIFLFSAISNDLNICKSITFVLVNFCICEVTKFNFSELPFVWIKMFSFLFSTDSGPVILDDKNVFFFFCSISSKNVSRQS